MPKTLASFLRRYTELPFLIDYLTSGQIALLNPASWDDRNDAFYLDLYARKAGYKATYALCLTQAAETYHHWKIFSQGSSGVCIEFHKDPFVDYAREANIRCGSINYKSINDLRSSTPELNELPFLKRIGFSDEHEFRLFVANKSGPEASYRIPMPLFAINRIILSPWLPKAVAVNVKKAIHAIPGCKDIDVHRSSLTENEDWKNAASKSA